MKDVPQSGEVSPNKAPKKVVKAKSKSKPISSDADKKSVVKQITIALDQEQVPSGWDSISTGHGEEDLKISAEQEAEIARIAGRKKIAAPIAEKLIFVDRDAYLNLAAERKLKRKDQLTEGELRGINAKFLDFQRTQKQFAEDLATTNIPEDQLEEYALTILSSAKTITPTKEDLHYLNLGAFIRASRNLEVAKTVEKFATNWHDRFLSGVDEDQRYNSTQHFFSVLHEISDSGRPGQPQREISDMENLFNVLADVHEFAYSLPTESEADRRIVNETISAMRQFGVEFRNPDDIRNVVSFFKEIASFPDKELVEKCIMIGIRYGKRYGLDRDALTGFKEKLIPAIEIKDPQVDVLNGQVGNIWSMDRNSFGVADFVCHSYALKITPENINELLMGVRDVPTTNLARVEQNRLDALTVRPVFGIFRDFVHDQRPGVHDVIEAMVKFYDTDDRGQLVAVLNRTDYLKTDDKQSLLLDKANYDRELPEVKKERTEANGPGVKAIDVLRRMNENTRLIEDKPPKTSDSEFNRLLLLAGNGDKVALQQAFDYANNNLIGAIDRREIGIGPNHILAFGWLEQKGFFALQGLKYEEQLSAFKEPWFASILKFQELTASYKSYDPSEFQEFMEGVTSSTSPEEAYKFIAERANDNMYGLAQKYKAKGKTETGLSSGNITHELVGLQDLRLAVTEQGKKAVVEKIKRILEPGYHPGD